MISRQRDASRRLTVPHVLSALALFVALGGTAVAVGIAKNSVGSPQIKPSGVRTSDIANGAVTTRKLRANAVTSGKVRNGTLRGVDINQSTLNAVRAANVLAVGAEGDGQCTLVNAPTGVSATREGAGTCVFTFPRDVSDCHGIAAVDMRLQPNFITLPGARTVFVKRFTNTPNVVRTQAYFDSSSNPDEPALTDLPVSLTLVC